MKTYADELYCTCKQSLAAHHVRTSVLFTNDLLTFHCQCTVMQWSRVDHLAMADHVRTDALCIGAASNHSFAQG